MPTEDPPIIWLRPKATGRGRPPAYDRSQIARAAIAIADVEGLEAVSMRRIAAAIGAGTMSLYRYVRTKDELHLLMIEEITPELDCADPGKRPAWRAALRTLALQIRGLVQHHAWFPEVFAGIGLPGPKGARGIDAVMTILDGAGMSDVEISQAVYTVLMFSIAATQLDMAEARAARRAGLTGAQWQAHQQRYLDVLAAGGEIPTLHRVSTNMTGLALDADAAFVQVLDRLLDGLAVFPAQDG